MATLADLLSLAKGTKGAYDAYQGAAGGDYWSAASGALGALRGANTVAEMTGNAVPYATPALSGLGSLLGLGYGGYQLAEGDLSGISSVIGGLGGAAATAAPIAASGTLGTTAAAAAPALAGVGTIAAPLAAVVAIGIANYMHQEEKRIENQTKESARLRQGANTGLARLMQTGELGRDLEKLPGFAPDKQDDLLDMSLKGFRTALDSAPVVQQVLGNQGQGGKASMTEAIDPAVIAKMSEQYYPELRDTQIGFTRALDAAAQGATDVPDWASKSFGAYDPAALVNSMSMGKSGVDERSFNPYWDVDYSKIVPGTTGEGVRSTLAQNLAPETMAPLEERFKDIGALSLPGTAPLTDQQIADANAQRQAAAQNVFDVNSVSGEYHDPSGSTWQRDPSAIAYSAPYQEGGTEKAWRDLGLNDEEIALGKTGNTDLPSMLAKMQARVEAMSPYEQYQHRAKYGNEY